MGDLRRRKGCDEECLRRIAARLCNLDGCRTKKPEKADICCVSGREGTQDPVSTDEASNKGCCADDCFKVLEPKPTCGSKSTDIATSCKESANCNVSLRTDVPSDGCCSGSESATGESSPACCSSKPVAGDTCCSTANPPQSENCKDQPKSCCSTVTATDVDQGCGSPRKCGQTDQTGESAAGIVNEECSDGCCNVVEPLVPSDDCDQGCCKTSSSGSSTAPSIQEGCKDECCQSKSAKPSVTGSACNDHLQAAMDRYEAMLKRGQCLCRSVLDQLGFNCCLPVTGDMGISSSEKSVSKAVGQRNVAGDSKIPSRCSYTEEKPISTRQEMKASSGPNDQEVDIEKDAAREHVVLNVAGMTCTGCSRKMMNVLRPIAGLSNAQVTFVSGTAEFDLNTSVSERVEDVLSEIEKKTGFKCSRIVSGRQALEILMSESTAKQLEDSANAGIISVTRQKKGSYEVTYDPTVIGARSVLPPGTSLAPPTGHVGIAEGKRRLIETAISTIVAAVLTIPVVVLEWGSTPVPPRTVSIVTLVLGTCVQAVAVPEFYVGALKSLIYSHVIEMDMLVVISITAAYVYSVVAFGLQEAGIKLEQKAFFETSTLLITLVLLGRLLAAWARMRAVSAVSLRSLQAETALLLQEDGSTDKIDARLLQFGDTIVVQSHSRIVTDGQVTSGATEVNESMVTGEALPIAKRIGDGVIAGTINGPGSIHVRLSRLPGENSITDIADMVEAAVASRPRVQELADKVASWFIPAVMGIAIVVFCIWVGVAIHIRGRDGGGAVGLAITYAIAVLAISCPCALGLAVPMVLVIASGIAARGGTIIKAADAIERGYQVTDVVFDKTGTLTEGDLQVVHEEKFSTSVEEEEIAALTKAIVEGSQHPVSIAVAAHLSKASPDTKKAALGNVVSIPGAGIEAQSEGLSLKAGNPHWLGLGEHPSVTALLHEAMTLFCLTLDNKLIFVCGLKSTLRSNAGAVMTQLKNRNITCHIVSGDSTAVVTDVANTLGVPLSQVLARSSPADKQQYVHDLQRSGRKVLFLGDGTNDAVAIAQANVGVQMGSASDVTGAVADVVLLSHDIAGVVSLLNLSHAAVRRVIFNFGWSAVYNLFAILLASGAFVEFRIPPSYAGLGEIVSVSPVILAAGTLALGRKI